MLPGLLVVVWLGGGVVWFVLTARRIACFHRLLRFAAPAPAALQNEAEALARRMGLRRCPAVWLLPGPVPPLVWAVGGRARLFFPRDLLGRLGPESRAALLVHELAHLRRRDHWVRALEWLAAGLYWWYPLVWYGCRRLRAAEEECCDAWVVSELPGAGADYAGALLETVDFLAEAPSVAVLPPAASGFGRTYFLKRRLTLVMDGGPRRSLSLSGRLVLLGLASILLPFGLTRAPGSAAAPAAPKEKEIFAMSRLRLWVAALATAWAAAPALAEAPAPADDAAFLPGAQRLAERIDELIAARWAKEGVQPAAPADDAAFLRRLYLDVAGRIPAVSDLRRFLADRSPDKRARAIDELLDSPAYARHFANLWLELLAPEAAADFQRRGLLPNLDAWLRRQFADNVPYDRMVRDLLSLPLVSDPRQRQALQQALFRFDAEGSPAGFYVAKEGKPENLAASTARLFLGVRLECAQCHDHPFGRWTREQFWSQAAFFAGLRNGDVFNVPTEMLDRRELTIPNTERVAQARFLDGSEPLWKFKTSARTTLAEWMTRRDNPYFARAAANRLWAHFFGAGLVEPVDDLNDSNPPTHPELLDELARQFAGHGFDFKFLIRAMARSKTYQLRSAGSDSNPRLYARMALKGLTPWQLYDSFVQATGYRDPNGPDARRRFFFDGSLRAQFLAKFASRENRSEAQTSIPQALALMNGRLMAEMTDPEKGELLAAVANAPFLDTRGRVETLFLAALSRPPRPDEAARYSAYVDKGGAAGDPKKALADVFWALLNSTEFPFNH